MSMLKNISNTELANIVSGQLPNPVVDAPTMDHDICSGSNSNKPSPAAPQRPILETSKSSGGGVSAYQHSLHSLLRRQLSNKRKSNRRSLPALDVSEKRSSSTTAANSQSCKNEADKDVVEIDLNSSNSSRSPYHLSSSTTMDHHPTAVQTPVYPALLLNATQSDFDLSTESELVSFLPPMGTSTSAPDLSRWDHTMADDYFGPLFKQEDSKYYQRGYTLEVIISNQRRLVPERDTEDIPDSSSMFSMRNGSVSDEAYGEKLYMSRSAKIKRWCSLRIEDQPSNDKDTEQHHHQHHAARFTRTRENDRAMPTILVTSDEAASPTACDDVGDGTLAPSMVDKLNIVNDVPWVDWLEEYKMAKNAEMKRRQSIPDESSAAKRHIDHRLTNWWSIVKTNAEHYTSHRRLFPVMRRHSSFDGKDVDEKEPAAQPGKSFDRNNAAASPPTSTTSVPEKRRSAADDSDNVPSKQHMRRCFTTIEDSDENISSGQNSPRFDQSFRQQGSPLAVAATKSSSRKSLTAAAGTNVGYRFFHPNYRMGLFGRLGRIFGSTSEGDDRSSSANMQSTIRSRLQYAKDACDAEMRYIIDGLNEYVERGLQYVENMDEILEQGVHEMSSEEEGDTADHQSDYEEGEQVYSNANVRSRNSIPPAEVRTLHDIEEKEETEDVKTPRHHDSARQDYFEDTSSQVSNMVTMITEDSYLPTPFILTLQDLITLAQSVMDTSLDMFLDHHGLCAELVSKIQAVGVKWDIHPEWPCREWYVRLLLGVAALNRVLDWWQAEKGFWASSWGPTPVTTTTTTSDTDGGATTDMESVSGMSKMDESSEYGGDVDVAGRQRLATGSSSDGIQMDSSIVPPKNDAETSSLYTQDDPQVQLTTDEMQLQQIAERSQNSTIIMELSLGTTAIQYVSPVWLDVIG